jgi:hypothetical protein
MARRRPCFVQSVDASNSLRGGAVTLLRAAFEKKNVLGRTKTLTPPTSVWRLTPKLCPAADAKGIREPFSLAVTTLVVADPRKN